MVHNDHAGSGELPSGLFHDFVLVSLATADYTLKEAIAKSHDNVLIAVWGGDGTSRSIACLTADTDATFLPCPGGTHNHFAKAAGFSNVDDVGQALAHTASHLVDVGKVDDEVFLNNLSIGWYVDLVARRERYQKHMPRQLAKIVSVFVHMFYIRRLRVTIDEQPERVWMVWIGNGIFAGEPGEVPQRESLTSGMLDIRILRAGTRFPKFKALIAILGRRVETSPLIDQRTANSCMVTFRSPSIDVALDGERVRLSKPLHVFSTQSLRLMNPN